MDDLCIVIVSYNTRDMLRDCLRALPAAAEGLRTSVRLIDNASADGSPEMAAREFPETRIVANDRNVGFARANNQALEQAGARYLLLLNPDTEARPGSLALAVAHMDADPRMGACGPMLLNTDGSLQRNGGCFPTPLREFLHVTGLRRLAPRRYATALEHGREDFGVETEVDQVSGACLFVRAEAAQQVGLLDERFFMFYEDVEWCWRLRRAGWSVRYLPDVQVVHHWMGSVRQSSRRMTEQLLKSQLLYYRKTGGPAAAAAVLGVIALGLCKNVMLHAGSAVKRRLRSVGRGSRPQA
ncbi:MAG: glycosyltransferase family 2 protein [Armatimonadetes bacterium]|nr:glycosyltransferase family 2 protein [Armatimonadota bacterium]